MIKKEEGCLKKSLINGKLMVCAFNNAVFQIASTLYILLQIFTNF